MDSHLHQQNRDEKHDFQELLSHEPKDPKHQFAAQPQRSFLRVCAKVAGVVALLTVLMINCDVQLSRKNLSFSFLGSSRSLPFPSFQFTSDKSEVPVEALEVGLPIAHSNLVHEQLVLDHTFANSWGKPAKATFSAPKDVPFNKAVLKLEVTVSGVQYDRLAHVFINDIPVWRTSTSEPGNKTVHSCARKDVTNYLSLFSSADGGDGESGSTEIVLKLDNLVNKRLTGAISTKLSVMYYDEPVHDSRSALSRFLYLGARKPAHRVTKLIKPKENSSPILYYPGDTPRFQVPAIPQNTTALRLSLYASGNAAEEFWYTNIADRNLDYFRDSPHHVDGHGPVRLAKVYLNGEHVHTAVPGPVVYTGGFSPALWRPIVPVNAFDVEPIDVDLTPFLPKMWGKETSLEVEIVSDGDDASRDGGKVGSNWIIAADLLRWENPDVVSCEGEFAVTETKPKRDSISLKHGKGKLLQIISAKHQVDVSSTLNYKLSDGKEYPVHFERSSYAKFSNLQNYARYGNAQVITAVVSGGHSTKFSSPDETYTLSTNRAYPIVLHIDFDKSTSNQAVTFRARIANVYGLSTSINGEKALRLSAFNNGTSVYTLTKHGNYGFGNTHAECKANMSAPLPEQFYSEVATAVNGTVVSHDVVDLNFPRRISDKSALHNDESASSNDKNAFGGEQPSQEMHLWLREHLAELQHDHVIDETTFEKFCEEYNAAMLDHELTHSSETDSLDEEVGELKSIVHSLLDELGEQGVFKHNLLDG